MERAGEDSGSIETLTSKSISLVAPCSRTFFSRMSCSAGRVVFPACMCQSCETSTSKLFLVCAIAIKNNKIADSMVYFFQGFPANNAVIVDLKPHTFY
jgi:hypothetical protein